MPPNVLRNACTVFLAALIASCSASEATLEPEETSSETDAPEALNQELRRLTRLEFVNSLRHVLGPVHIEDTEPDLYRSGLARVGALDVQTSRSGTEQYGFAVESAVDEVFADPAWRRSLIGCSADEGETCARDFIQRVGQRAWRRPLNTQQIDRYLALQGRCQELLGDFDQSLSCVAQGLLQSPYFLYRNELPSDGLYKGYNMASRLAYMLWSAPPDVTLLNAAHAGQLDSAEGVRKQATRMLADPQARDGLAVFVEEWFHLDQLDRLERDILAQTSEEVQFALGRDGQLQPWLQWMGFAAREELRRTVTSHVFDDDGDYLDLLISDRTYIDPHLKAFYELSEDEDAQIGSGFNADRERIMMDSEADSMGFARAHHTPDSPRRGIMGTMAFLSQLGKQNETSPTRRGLYVMEKILCLEVGEPPDDIDKCERVDGVSRRDSMEVHHMCAASCAGCHVQMDPIGFAMDSFDTLGRYRTTDDWGFELDTSVEWTMVNEGRSTKLRFDSLRSMADTFYGLPEATDCVTQQMFRYGTGRTETAEDKEALKALTEAFVSDGRRLKSFLIHFVGTDAFRRAAPKAAPDRPTSTDPVQELNAIATEIFAESCTPCHVGTTLGGLDLLANETLKARLLKTSLELPSMPLVTPGNPERSYLWHKLSETHIEVGGSGDVMPPNGKLTNDELERIRQWITKVTP